MLFPPAYLITFGAYGNRLPGTSKPHVDLAHNEYKKPFAPTNPGREEAARRAMRHVAVFLTSEQRKLADTAINELSARFGWTIHACAVQTNHIHVVITAPREGEPLREALKAAASRALNQEYGKHRWWAEGGSCKYLWEQDYFRNSIEYVKRQRDF